jgi:hypothetical protein
LFKDSKISVCKVDDEVSVTHTEKMMKGVDEGREEEEEERV